MIAPCFPAPRRASRGRALLSLVLALVAATAFASCTSTAETSGGALCTYGQDIPCTGEGGCAGKRTCLPDLSGYGACDCAADGGAVDSGASDAAAKGDR
jgi:hypothetical protein